jgi:hypothetical protein
MNAVTEVFQKIDQDKADKQRQNWAAYADMLQDLVASKEICPDEFQLVLNMVEKTRNDVERDLELMRQRIQWAETASKRHQVERQLASAANELSCAEADYSEAMERLGSIVIQAREKLNLHHQEIALVVDAEDRLRSSCVDPGVLAEQRENEVEAKKLIEQLRRIEELLDPSSMGTPGHRYQTTKSEVARFERKIQAREWIFAPNEKAINQAELAKAKRRLESITPGYQAIQKQHDEIHAKLRELSAKSSELQSKKLTP